MRDVHPGRVIAACVVTCVIAGGLLARTRGASHPPALRAGARTRAPMRSGVAALEEVGAGAHALHDDLRELVKKATDGCVNIFVDAGANIGVHTRFLFEPAKYPESQFTKLFSNAFGAASNESAQLTCSLGFEPNPKHIKRHKALQRAYKRMGWQYSFFHFALGVNTSEELVFYENIESNGGNGAQNEYWAFSTTRLEKQNQSKVRVPSVSFDTVLAQIGKRRLPADQRHPRVLVKMDIEGSEYAVLPQVMMTGSLCRVVDYISLEWHASFAPMRFRPNQHLGLSTQAEAKKVASLLKAAMADGAHAGGCLTSVAEVDDETYLHDGVPFPVPYP